MIPVGYMYKDTSVPANWTEARLVASIFSLSACLAQRFADYINYWKHNEFWFFDSPEVMQVLAKDAGIDLSKLTLFYYELYEHEYVEETHAWKSIFAQVPPIEKVLKPVSKTLQGYDVATFYCGNKPEHSPLSCNSLHTTIPVNRYCLLSTFDEAVQGLESGKFDNSEPGPFRIFAVYTVEFF